LDLLTNLFSWTRRRGPVRRRRTARRRVPRARHGQLSWHPGQGARRIV